MDELSYRIALGAGFLLFFIGGAIAIVGAALLTVINRIERKLDRLLEKDKKD